MAAEKSCQGSKDGEGRFNRLDPKNEGIPLVIVDSSVAAKWFLWEEGSEEANALLQKEGLGAPDLLLYELTNVFVMQKYLSLSDIKSFLARFFEFQIQYFVLPEKSYFRTVELSRQFQITGYDASFVALAESLHVDFLTADLKLALKLKSLPFVRTLTME
jgi:predicted nucleic acid-binding protein